MSEIAVPELSLVVLVGTSGSGKSTFARKHFKPTAIVSSDACRGIVSDDENDQSATPDAFALLHHIAGVRLRRGLLTVVDATNVQPKAREALVKVARDHDVLPVAIVLDVPESVCVERNARRADRADLPARVIARQRRELRSGLRNLQREGFRKIHVLKGVEEVEDAVIAYEKAYNDRRDLTGPFDVIGDVHGCRAELETLLGELGYAIARDAGGRAVDAVHPAGRTVVFVGDLVDRGPDTPGVLRLAMGMVAAGHALCVSGNHENKLTRALDGRKVTVAHGLAESLDQLAAEDEEFRKAAREFCYGLVSHYVLDGGAAGEPDPGQGGPEDGSDHRQGDKSAACPLAAGGRPGPRVRGSHRNHWPCCEADIGDPPHSKEGRHPAKAGGGTGALAELEPVPPPVSQACPVPCAGAT